MLFIDGDKLAPDKLAGQVLQTFSRIRTSTASIIAEGWKKSGWGVSWTTSELSVSTPISGL